MALIESVLMSARRGDPGIMRHARTVWRAAISLRMPMIRPLFALLYGERTLRQTFGPLLLNFLYREPLLRYRCTRTGRRLQLCGSLPYIVGDGQIEIGDDVGIDTRNTWMIGFKVSDNAQLTIGNRVFVGYQNVFSVAKRITIGDDTMLAGNVRIFDNISHPISPGRRLRKESFTLDEASPVEIGRNVWIGDSVTIMRGVTIGDNSIIAAGSIVTKSIPANCLAAGNPAVVKREITESA